MSQQPDRPSAAAHGVWTSRPDAESVFAARMKRERERRDLSQAGLVDLVRRQGYELHPTSITKLERVGRDDRRNLRLNEALAIAAALDLSLDRMLSDDDLDEKVNEILRLHLEIAELKNSLAVSAVVTDHTRSELLGKEHRLAALEGRGITAKNIMGGEITLYPQEGEHGGVDPEA